MSREHQCAWQWHSPVSDSGCAGWVLGNMIPFWLILNALGHFRVPANVETVGLDDSYHGGSAYPGGPEEETDKSLRGAAASKAANGGAAGGATRVRTKPDRVPGRGSWQGLGVGCTERMRR